MKILLVEDNPELTQNVVNYLSAEGIICESATTLFEAQDKILSFGYDCILLDLMLPDGNGLDLIEIIKSQKIKTTVLIISAKDALDDKLKGLDQGADDYLPKPFHLSELLARLKAIFRRSKLGGFDEVVFNEITIEIHQLLAKVNDQVLELTKKEFDLLLFFITNKNRVLGKQAIAQHLWGDYTDDLANFDFVYQHVKNLRKKITGAGGKDYISTVYGIGYKFDPLAS
ncbi:response regulator transcription factor [Algoriphagus boritolerans]|uniref:DNA-binding response regulator, OmpR family, contains REC and winged-helix (WHTH) domain n=1 Tax=Algoriphagus boritolerans DSM 17298 = JCM 18970 TaxID=1120964 RepID=A0A1H5RSN9_9BACT|nr:response regulator transcription factor [Algoriphagus boritolerans]SEF40521.1 DNA-binding response regulator, OmpR family, contains REC and winged-helix (wHTH) domain [Algoriphagus boritolerans DSM 17298 = JCM 18970]